MEFLNRFSSEEIFSNKLSSGERQKAKKVYEGGLITSEKDFSDGNERLGCLEDMTEK